jgi:hypothetical protein
MTALSLALIFSGPPAFALDDLAIRVSGPRPIKAFSYGAREIEILAITRRARADTPISRAHLEECENMAKILPGYPQPAFVTVDFRIKF